ncbi:MAG: glycoside hydrolase family 15 protein [Fimbriimonadaceae bacterium]|nr:glycoside hydrolase family 15 protein [Fimbriimonadaceae bacterium]
MPRSIVLSNGRLFVGYDGAGQVKDLTWPRVGMPNHVVDRRITWGVWADGKVRWLGDPGWDVSARYEVGSLIAEWRAVDNERGLELVTRDAVSPQTDHWVKEMAIRDTTGRNRTVVLLATHDLALGQSDIENTAYWSLATGWLVHYRWEWAVGFRLDGDGELSSACGIAGFEGLEGTWRDADDGKLSGIPIAQGSVDSTLALRVATAANGEARAVWQAAWAESAEKAAALVPADPASLFAARREVDAADFDVLIAKSLQDEGGAWMAANDSDILETNRATYSNCWPRDGAIAAHLMVDMGRQEEARRFLEFCERIQRPEGPPFLQKYTAEGKLGSSWHPWTKDGVAIVPWQQDETALVLLAAAAYSARFGGFEGLIERCADFLASSVDAWGLPLPSWDMWEERYGVHTSTACVTARALREAGTGFEGRWDSVSEQMLLAVQERLFLAEEGRYARSLGDSTPDSALLFGLRYVPDLPHAEETVRHLGSVLQVGTGVGGVARYPGDYYFRLTEEAPGNPWVICTIWWETWNARLGDASAEARLEAWLRQVGGPTGILPEQLHAMEGTPLSVSPLAWSHVEAARFRARLWK